MHRRLRWGNVARTAAAVAVVAAVVAWPRLAPPDPAMPGNEAAPLAGDEPAWTPPRASGREDGQARSRRERTPKGRSAGRRKRSQGTGRGAGDRRKGRRAERRGRGAKRNGAGSRRVGSRGTKGDGSGQAGPADGTGRGGPPDRNESGAPGEGAGGGPGDGGAGGAPGGGGVGGAPGGGGRAGSRGAEAGIVGRPMGPGVAEPGGRSNQQRATRPRRSSGSRAARPRRRRRGPWRGCRRSARRSSRPDLGR